MNTQVVESFFDEMNKLATAIDTAAGHEVKVKVPPMRAVAAVRDPGSAGYIKPTVKFRIAGGAKNMGVTRPPTGSSAKRARSQARMVRAVAGRRPLGMPAPTPVY